MLLLFHLWDVSQVTNVIQAYFNKETTQYPIYKDEADPLLLVSSPLLKPLLGTLTPTQMYKHMCTSPGACWLIFMETKPMIHYFMTLSFHLTSHRHLYEI